jgi:hypothetical protein
MGARIWKRFMETVPIYSRNFLVNKNPFLNFNLLKSSFSLTIKSSLQEKSGNRLKWFSEGPLTHRRQHLNPRLKLLIISRK